MKKLMVSVVSLGLLFGVSMANAAKTANVKIAIVNIQKVLKDSPKLKAVSANLKSQFKSRQVKLTAAQKSLQAEVGKLTKNSSVMSASAKKKLETKIKTDREALIQQATMFQQDLSKAQGKVMKTLFTKINGIIKSIAKKNGYTMVLDAQVVAYAANGVDITSQVSKKFNAS